LALAACGVYGLVSFGVIQRTRELAIRRAIGATAADVVRLVTAQHAVPIGVGLMVGVSAGALGARWLTAFLAGVRPTDLVAVAAAIGLVAGSALMASAVPARRATRVDPMVALREA
jgi:putative ABC transport system permease protein